jgi:hypothetical protein
MAASLTRELAQGLLQTLDGISAERRVLFADLERRLVLIALVSGIDCIQAFPSLDRHAFRRRARNRIHGFRSGSRGTPDQNKAAAFYAQHQLRR